MSNLEFTSADGELIDVPYYSPISMLRYLMMHHPSVVVGGLEEPADRCHHLKAFWEAYRQHHPSHPIFKHHNEDLQFILPLAWHGDEGRGKRRGNTVVIGLETPLGLSTSVDNRKKCVKCRPPPHLKTKFSNEGPDLGEGFDDLVRALSTNNKGHSFLQHWPMFVLPGALYKRHAKLQEECLNAFGAELRRLFYEGVQTSDGQTFCGALIGAKGDLKWYTKVANLTRSFEHKGKVRDLLCCHECLAGSKECPYEDVAEVPSWSPTIFSQRPWGTAPPTAIVPFDNHRPEAQFKRDPFHLCKVGIFRDFIGSSVLLAVFFGYLGSAGTVNDKLERAYGHFRLFCSTTQRSAALRSFNKYFFMYPNKRAYPWVNAKGSDVTILMRWVTTLAVSCLNDMLDPSHAEPLRIIRLTAEAGLRFFDRLYAHGVFLDRDCAIMLYADCTEFINGFTFLANYCMTIDFNGYSMKPKIHLLKHLAFDLYQGLQNGCKFLANPLLFNCEGNEDFIGRASRLSRKVDSRVETVRVLKSMLLKADLLHRKSKKKPRGHRRRV